MSCTLKIIKSKSFKVDDADHTHYTAAYKGRVFGVSTLAFALEDENTLVVEDNVLTIKGKVSVKKREETTHDLVEGTTTRTYLDIVPELDLSLAEV